MTVVDTIQGTKCAMAHHKKGIGNTYNNTFQQQPSLLS